MASNGKQLAALAVFRSLYDNRKDIFTIICEFIKDVIYSHKLYTFNVTQITDLLKNDFDFLYFNSIFNKLNYILT